MIFSATPLAGAWVVDVERAEDERGFFARSWCAREFEEHRLNPHLVQCNISFNKRRGTLRGMHYQIEPHREVKLVRCTRGAIYDVIIDLRTDSATYKQHVAVVLDSDSRKMLYIPEGFAHGFQTLEDDTEVFYQMTAFYAPQHARGVRWDDPAFGICWPQAERTISGRDRGYPDFSG